MRPQKISIETRSDNYELEKPPCHIQSPNRCSVWIHKGYRKTQRYAPSVFYESCATYYDRASLRSWTGTSNSLEPIIDLIRG